MVQLNASTLSSVHMTRGVTLKTERVIQFGEGGFLRAFCDWMSDKANEEAGMDAGVFVQGAGMEETTEAFFKELLTIACGKQTKSEMHDYREIAIFKDGVTL